MNGRTLYFLQHRWLERGLRTLLGGVFLYAGASKFGSPQSFADIIATFRLLPTALINPLALGLPPFELALGGLLLCGWRRREAALGVLGLTAVFVLALGSALVRGIAVDCGCFGGTGHVSSTATNIFALGRDLLLSAATAVLYWGASRSDHRSEV